MARRNAHFWDKLYLQCSAGQTERSTGIVHEFAERMGKFTSRPIGEGSRACSGTAPPSFSVSTQLAWSTTALLRETRKTLPLLAQRLELPDCYFSASSRSTFPARPSRALASTTLPLRSTSHISGMAWMAYFCPNLFSQFLPSKYCGQGRSFDLTNFSRAALSLSKLMPTTSKP